MMEDEYRNEKRLVRRAFDRAAQSYDAAAVLQREVGERMVSRLDYVKVDPGRILDAGSGTGKGKRDLSARFPQAALFELDLAPSMLMQSRPEVPWWKKPFAESPLQVCGDIERLPLKSSSFGMVWSNLALQWCDDLDAALCGFHRVLEVDGLLMFSTFGPDTLKELRSAFSGMDGHVHVNRFIDMHDIGDALIRAGFSNPVLDMENFTLTYSDVKSVMMDLKAIGAHNAMIGRPRGLFGKNAWARVVDSYERMRKDGLLPATFEVVYGHAWKAQPNKLPDGSGIVRFERRLK